MPSPSSTLLSADLPGAVAFRRFRQGLFLVAVLILTGLAVHVVSDSTHDLEEARDEAARHTRNLARLLDGEVRGTLRAADLAVGALAGILPATEDAPAGRDAALAHLAGSLAGLEGLRALLAAGPDGAARLRVAGDPAAAGDSAREAARFHRDHPQAGTRVTVAAPGRLTVSRRLSDSRGEFAGAAVAVLDLTGIGRLFATLDIGPHGVAALLGRDGATLARYPGAAVGTGAGEAGAPDEQVAALLAGQPDGVGEWTLEEAGSPLGNRGRVRTVRVVAGAPLAIAVGLAEEDYLTGWRAALWRDVADLGLVGAAMLGLKLLLLRYLRRLERMTLALRESERRALAIFDSTYQHTGILAPDGTVLALNRASLEFSASEPGRDIGRPTWERPTWAAVPESAERVRAAVLAAAAGESVRFEAEVQAHDGSRRTVDFALRPVRDETGAVVLLVPEARDITEQRRMERSLRRSEARLRSYLDAAMEGIFVTDAEGCLIDVNPAACQMVDRTRDELLGMHMDRLVPPEHPLVEAARAGIAALPERSAFRGEMVLCRKDGGVRLAEINAVRLDGGGVLGVARDVTERRRSEEALRSSRARLAALVQALPDLAFIIDVEGRYQEVLGGGEGNLLTAPAESLPGRRLDDVLPADIAARITGAIRWTVALGKPQVLEYALTVPAGRRWFEGRTTVLPADFGTRPMVLLLVRDITERVHTAERLAHARDEAESASRAKSAFLATMSHELRTPLNAIIGFSEIMVQAVFGPLGSDRYHDYVRHIHDSGTHLLDLINDVLDMSKLEAGRYTLEEGEIDVLDLLESCLALSGAPAERGGVHLRMEVPAGLPRLRADGRAARQIVLNLLSNAVKFTPEGGSVTLSAGMDGDGGLRVAVTDTGIGIEPEALRTIAVPFQQADASITRRFGGTGLGLAISRNLMELHGGRLDLTSEPGRGTVATVRFPPERVVETEALSARL